MNNQQVLLIKRPTGLPRDENWKLNEKPVEPIKDGEILIKVKYLSLDPAMRGWMNEGKSYIEPVALGEPMRAGGVGEVVQSNDPSFQPGDHVSGVLNAQSYAITTSKGLAKIDPNVAPLPTYLGTLGMPGLTAYFGLYNVGNIKPEDTVLISGGAGAVGAVAGQIAKNVGCKVIGIAGGQEKCQYMKEIGFDGVIDYKSESIYKALKEAAPKGIDVYFDNVGGETLDIALSRLRYKGRIVICGAISQYNSENVVGPANYLSLLVNRARMEGFVVFDYVKEYPKAMTELIKLYTDGKLKSKEHIVKGLETFNDSLNMLFSGKNFGKLVLEI